MFTLKSVDWWRNQLHSATEDFVKNPNDITMAKIKSLLNAYQHDYSDIPAGGDEHERVMDYR